MIIPDQHIFPETATGEHWHTPSTGGEICYNNLQWVVRMNALIREYNKCVDNVLFRLTNPDADYIPYIEVDEHPTVAWNVHHHSSEYDGGLIVGGGIHDHRDNSQGGYGYAVYHPGSSLPKLGYEQEEIFQ